MIDKIMETLIDGPIWVLLASYGIGVALLAVGFSRLLHG